MTTAQDQQSRELLPCPFCGREAMMSHSRDGEVCNVRCAGWSVGNCLGAGPNCYTEAEAIAGWNRRAPAEQAARALPAGMEPVGYMIDWPDEPELGHYFAEKANDGARSQALHTAAQVLAMIDAGIPGNKQPPGWSVTEDMHIAAVKVLHRATGVDGLPQRLVDAMLAAAPRPPAAQDRYRLLVRGVDTIQAEDEFLQDDAVTWQPDTNGIFVGMTYVGNVLLPARRAIKAGP